MTRYDCNIMIVQYLYTTIYHGEPDRTVLGVSGNYKIEQL